PTNHPLSLHDALPILLVADEAVASTEHERETPRPEQDAAQASVDDALEQDVDGLARAGEAGLEGHETRLHEEHQKRRHQHPQGVDRKSTRLNSSHLGI